jgi:tetratricopeptide (TPR) repeat protein
MNLRSCHYYLLDAFILLLAIAAVYGRLVGYNFQASWDDNVYIINNSFVHGFSWEHVKSVFQFTAYKAIGQYNPLSMLSYMLDFTLWRGLNPEGYHLTNIVIHSLNGLLVYRLLLRLHGERLLACVATAIFLFHPVQVESVGWISERKGLLSLFFLLLSWEGYCRYRDAEKGNGRFAYIVSVIAFLFSLLAKTAGVVLPVVLLLYDFCFLKKGSRLRLADKAPFIIASGIFSAIEIYSGATNTTNPAPIGYHGGSPLATFYTMLTVFCRYLRLLVWPSGLNVEHLPPVYRTPELPVIAAALLLAALAYAGYCLFKVNRKMGFWMIFFWIGLFPVSQIIPQILMMYEHYLYMPIIGVAALVGYGAIRLRDRLGGARAVILYAALLLWLLALSATSFQRVPVWKDSLALFTDATAKSPSGSRIWQMLGEVHRSLGNNEAARVAFERSLELKPVSTDALWSLAQFHTENGELDRGNDYLQRLLKINPEYVMGWATLGNQYLARKNYRKAGEMYNRALALQPDALEVRHLLGKLAVIENKYDEARSHFNAIEVDTREWKLAENAYQLIRVESLAGRMDEAVVWLEKALQRGYSDYYTLNTNFEMNTLWNSPKFGYLMQQYFPEEENRQQHFKAGIGGN